MRPTCAPCALRQAVGWSSRGTVHLSTCFRLLTKSSAVCICSEAAFPAALSLWNYFLLWWHWCTSLPQRQVRGSSVQFSGPSLLGSRVPAAWWLAASCDIMLLICSWTWRTCMRCCTHPGFLQIMGSWGSQDWTGGASSGPHVEPGHGMMCNRA